MNQNNTIYFISANYCKYCILFKNIIEYLKYENNFNIIDVYKLKFSEDIVLNKDLTIQTPLFYIIENNKKNIIDNDLLFNKLTNNNQLLQNEDFIKFCLKKKND